MRIETGSHRYTHIDNKAQLVGKYDFLQGIDFRQIYRKRRYLLVYILLEFKIYTCILEQALCFTANISKQEYIKETIDKIIAIHSPNCCTFKRSRGTSCHFSIITASTHKAARIVRTRYTNHIIITFLPERIDLKVKDLMFPKSMCPAIK